MCVRRALTGPQAQSRPDFPIRAVFWLRLLENLLISLITVSITPAAAVRRLALRCQAAAAAQVCAHGCCFYFLGQCCVCQACVHDDTTTRVSYIVLPLLCTALYFARYIKWARVGACRARPSVRAPKGPILRSSRDK